MAQKQFTRNQGLAIIVAVVVSFGLLLWGGTTLLRGGSSGPAAPQEVQPVQEQVVAGGREEGVQAPAPSSDADARRQETLQNLKYSATHGN